MICTLFIAISIWLTRHWLKKIPVKLAVDFLQFLSEFAACVTSLSRDKHCKRKAYYPKYATTINVTKVPVEARSGPSKNDAFTHS